MCPPGEFAELLRAEDIPVIEFPGTALSFRFTLRNLVEGASDFCASAVAIRRAANETGADVIHANSVRAGLLAHLAGIADGFAVIVHIHDVLPAGPVARLVRSVLIRRSAALIAVSASTRTALLKGFRESRVTVPVVINPIDARQLLAAAPDRRVAREMLHIPRDTLLMGIVAQITPWKGQDTVIRGLPDVLDEVPTAHLLIVGEPRFVDPASRYDNRAYLAELEALADALGVARAVTFCGHRDDVPTVIRALDLLLLPSWTEPLGRSMVEAMVLGTPVLATNRGGPSELIVDGESGFLAPPRDPRAWARLIIELLHSPTRRARAAERAHAAVVDRLDLGRYVAEMTSLYEQVSAGRRQGGATRSRIRGRERP
jgi:glycosyltransferase involved in cell wall biosynthesis